MLSLIAIPRFQLRLKVWDFVNSFQDRSLEGGGGNMALLFDCNCGQPQHDVFLAMTKATQTL